MEQCEYIYRKNESQSIIHDDDYSRSFMKSQGLFIMCLRYFFVVVWTHANSLKLHNQKNH